MSPGIKSVYDRGTKLIHLLAREAQFVTRKFQEIYQLGSHRRACHWGTWTRFATSSGISHSFHYYESRFPIATVFIKNSYLYVRSIFIWILISDFKVFRTKSSVFSSLFSLIPWIKGQFFHQCCYCLSNLFINYTFKT